MTNLPVKAHASLGASSAHRWMACPGSVALEAPLPGRDTDHSRAGTAAHAVAEKSLVKGVDPSVWLDTEIEGVLVDQEMVDAVTLFVEHVKSILAQHAGARLWVEKQFSLSTLAPPAPMFGTADIVIYAPGVRTLFVRDLKYGTGHVVEAEGNPQLRYYGLGAALAVQSDLTAGLPQIDVVDMGIVQPRAYHPDGPIRRVNILFSELVEWAGDLLTAADRALAPDAPLVAGPHCRFCKASAICPARKAEAQAVAQIEFADPVLPSPPAPASLTVPELVQVLDRADIVEDWIKAIRQHVHDLIERGHEVPGYKLVQKRPTRKWASEADTRLWLEDKGYAPEEIEVRELKSPAQIEKLVGKKSFPEGLIVKQSSGTTLAPTSDLRPALPAGPQADFVALS